MDRAVTSWLSSTPLPPSLTAPLAARLRKTRYTLYGPLLLLPASTLLDLPSPTPDLTPLYACISRCLKVTHIALSSPIPSTSPITPSDIPNPAAPNILRAPYLNPLYGDFGPARLLSPHTDQSAILSPSPEDFTSAFWVTTRQNSIAQTFAPRWTMFSRGNVAEKARILTLGSVERAVREGRERGGMGCAAVDLYVGIGYFAFSYLRAGVGAVVGWDLNGWSLEGLRRGAGENGFRARIVAEGNGIGHEGGGGEGEGRIGGLLAFLESNEKAARRMAGLRTRLPPVRHVNCGLLPTSRESWGTAVEVLDPLLGGWVHVHENLAVVDIEGKVEEMRTEFERLAEAIGRRVTVEVEYVNRLKSYAPGVMHCVVDLHLAPFAERA